MTNNFYELRVFQTSEVLPEVGRLVIVSGGTAIYDGVVWVTVPTMRRIQWDVLEWAEFPQFKEE